MIMFKLMYQMYQNVYHYTHDYVQVDVSNVSKCAPLYLSEHLFSQKPIVVAGCRFIPSDKR